MAEDQPAIRTVLREFLEGHGYKVLEAQEDGNEAVEIAKNYVGRIDVLVADVIMPHVRGTELAKFLTKPRPKCAWFSSPVIPRRRYLKTGCSPTEASCCCKSHLNRRIWSKSLAIV